MPSGPSAPVRDRKAWRIKALVLAAGVLSLILAATLYWRDDIMRTRLDPSSIRSIALSGRNRSEI